MRSLGRCGGAAALLALAGCGYHLAHAPVDPLGPFSVVPGATLVADAPAIAAGALSRSAARRLGEVLVRRLLGYPEPGEP